jgi:epoxyqueuosine reductase
MAPAPDPSRQQQALSRYIKTLARDAGFDICRITSPDRVAAASKDLAGFVANGFHGTMDWLAETQARRGDPRVLWPEVGSIVMLGMNYGPDADPRGNLDRPGIGNISVYARNRDYHDLIKGRLKDIGSRFAARAQAAIKVFVDTAPVMEKPLAAAAGLGWQGKHTNLVSREHGSWLFLGSIFTETALIADEAETDHCGSCRACLDACPTNAFPAPYRIDARRCISYLTIEHKGPIEPALRARIGNRIYGCDDCLAACPWNKFASTSREMKLAARADLMAPPLAELLVLDDAAFRALFSGSPVKRIGRNRFIRNCLIAAGNSGDADLAALCRGLLTDASPDVRGMAVWALARLERLTDDADVRAAHQRETDPDVLAEWQGAGF